MESVRFLNRHVLVPVADSKPAFGPFVSVRSYTFPISICSAGTEAHFPSFVSEVSCFLALFWSCIACSVSFLYFHVIRDLVLTERSPGFHIQSV